MASILRNCKFLMCILLFLFPLITVVNSQKLTSSTCPTNSAGGKDEPSTESNMHACRIFECSSCCNAETSAELAIMPLGKVGIVNFAQCGKLTDACSEETTYLECFYQCSPNLFPWMNTDTKKVSRIPICASFCDAWYSKCMLDKTCATGHGNWQTLLGKDANGTVEVDCRGEYTCRNYSTVYKNGRNLCNNIWDDAFIYTNDTEPCLHPSNPKKNAEVVKKMNENYQVEQCFPDSISYTDWGLIVGIALGVLAGVCIIVALVAYFLTRKKSKDDPKKKNVELAPPEEMENLKNVEPKTAKPAKESNGDSDHDTD